MKTLKKVSISSKVNFRTRHFIKEWYSITIRREIFQEHVTILQSAQSIFFFKLHEAETDRSEKDINKSKILVWSFQISLTVTHRTTSTFWQMFKGISMEVI